VTEPRVAYVVALWSGERRVMVPAYRDDRSFFLEGHLRRLKELKHGCRTVIFVVNECLDRSESFENTIGQAAERLPGFRVEVVRRANEGMSYGALAAAFERYGDQFDYFVFLEDDYFPAVDGFDRELRSFFGDDTGWVCGRYAGCVGYERAHAAMPGGMISTKALRAMKDRYGAITCGSGSAYSDVESAGQAGMSWAMIDCGYGIKDVLGRYSSPFVNHKGERVVYGDRRNPCLIEPQGADGFPEGEPYGITDFPLEYMDLFPKGGEPIPLPVSSIVLETRPEMMNVVRDIIRWHRRWFKFAREVIVSCEDPKIPGVCHVRIPEPPPPDERGLWYSDYCVRWLHRLCDAPFALVWQWDGFIVNPEMWTPEFLEYDYVGAPVVAYFWLAGGKHIESQNPNWKNPVEEFSPIVGNGGFSLRSKRFLEASSALGVPTWSSTIRNEDVYLCVERRAELERAGIKFCPVDLAYRFSKDEDTQQQLWKCFGFHDRDNMREVKAMMEEKYLG
jgi:hypothetical protein